MARDAETAARNEDSRTQFQIMKKLGRKKIFGRQGQIRRLEGKQREKHRWKDA